MRRTIFLRDVVPAVLLIALLMAPMGGVAAGAGASDRAGRPNFLVVLADDMGFSDAGCYGGEIATPHLDRLADRGLRFTRFYSTGRCWPSRAALLTGYYAQQVRMDPVRRGFDGLPAWAPLLSQRLGRLGYRSYHSGKWHIHLERKAVRDGGFDRSYVLRDHNRFFSPQGHELNDERLPPVDRSDDFYVTDAIADYAVDFLQQHAKEHEDKPWLTYLAFTAPHFPLHAPQETIDKYRERYEAGWDAVRRRRLERMKEMGIVGQSVKLPPRQPDVVPRWNLYSESLEHVFGPKDQRGGWPWVQRSLRQVYGPGEVGRAVAWDSLTDEQQGFQATKMAIHAAMIDRMDAAIGRVLDQVEAMGQRKNTVVLFMSDNGASAELIVRGDGHEAEVPMGSADSYLCLGPGWSTASNTPYRLHKSWVHEGGIASPLIVSWPAGIGPKDRGELRHTPGHFIDVAPTLIELAGGEPITSAERSAGEKTDGPPLPGRSLVPTFTEDRHLDRPHLFFRHDGHRALRADGWKIVSRRRHERWQLYNLSADPNELNDLSDKHPQKVRRLERRWKKLDARFRGQATSK